MKEKDGKVDYKQHELILYVEKEDDTYGPITTGSYISEKYFDDFLENKAAYSKLDGYIGRISTAFAAGRYVSVFESKQGNSEKAQFYKETTDMFSAEVSRINKATMW